MKIERHFIQVDKGAKKYHRKSTKFSMYVNKFPRCCQKLIAFVWLKAD